MPPRTATKSKSANKENAPPAAADASFDAFEDDYGVTATASTSKAVQKTKVKVPSTKPRVDLEQDQVDQQELPEPVIAVSGAEDGSRLKTLEREIKELQSTLKRRTKERDDFSRQFEELSSLRSTDSEAVFEKYQAASEARARAQDDLVASLRQTNDTLTGQIKQLQADIAARPAPSATCDEKGTLVAELKSLKDALRKKDSETALARRDLEAELNMAKQALAAANKKAASAGPVDASESAKDSHVIKLYEDMTNLNIPVIKVSQSKLGDEVTFVCVQTVGEQSLNFKLRLYTTAEKHASKPGEWVYSKMLDYHPQGLDNEDKAFVKRLEIFATKFTIPRAQTASFFEALKEKMVRE